MSLQSQEISARAAEKTMLLREEAVKDKEEKAMANASASASAAEVRARAEHLKMMRDKIIQKKSKERKQEASKQQAAAPPPQQQPPIAAQPSSNLKNGAGFSSADGDDGARARLTTHLASNMKASLLGDDHDTLDHAARMRNQDHMGVEKAKQEIMNMRVGM